MTKPRVSFLRYEDFVAASRTVISDLFRRVGLEGTSPIFHDEREVEVGLSHNTSGNPVRFQTGVTQLRTDDAWRSRLSVPRQRYVHLITWPHSATSATTDAIRGSSNRHAPKEARECSTRCVRVSERS